MIGQNALAQAMQGGDRRHVELGQRHLQLAEIGFLQTGLLLPTGLQPVCIQDLGIFGERTVAGGQTDRPQQTRTQSFAQFFRGGIGEGGHHHLARGHAVFQQQTQIQHADGPGLAGSGAGFEQTASSGRQIQRAPIAGRAHGCASGKVMMSFSSWAKSHNAR